MQAPFLRTEERVLLPQRVPSCAGLRGRLPYLPGPPSPQPLTRRKVKEADSDRAHSCLQENPGARPSVKCRCLSTWPPWHPASRPFLWAFSPRAAEKQGFA